MASTQKFGCLGFIAVMAVAYIVFAILLNQRTGSYHEFKKRGYSNDLGFWILYIVLFWVLWPLVVAATIVAVAVVGPVVVVMEFLRAPSPLDDGDDYSSATCKDTDPEAWGGSRRQVVPALLDELPITPGPASLRATNGDRGLGGGDIAQRLAKTKEFAAGLVRCYI